MIAANRVERAKERCAGSLGGLGQLTTVAIVGKCPRCERRTWALRSSRVAHGRRGGGTPATWPYAQPVLRHAAREGHAVDGQRAGPDVA